LEVLRQGAPTSGEACIQFEKDFAAYCGTSHARAVSNGTAALFLSLVALDIKHGDRILTTPMTWIATCAAGATLGAEVDFVDIDPVTCNLDPAQLEAKITPHTKAIFRAPLWPVLRHGSDPRHRQTPQRGGSSRTLATPWALNTKVVRPAAWARLVCFSFTNKKIFPRSEKAEWWLPMILLCSSASPFNRSHCTRVYGRSTKYCSLDESRFPMANVLVAGLR